MTPPVKNEQLEVLVLEPYYGGSHKSFLKGLKNLPFTFDFMTLPARKWKWRMRLAAPYFAQRLHELKKMYDFILCSTFVDVAAFRGLAPSWVNEVPVLTYFHENQFAYPTQVHYERDFHYALTNMTTALASDCIAFNSQYNLDSFLSGIEKLHKKSHDLKLDDPVNEIRGKSKVIYPGIDFSDIDDAKKAGDTGPPVILWNHRWEHDKNPELFFKTLFDLDRAGIAFSLVILGEKFQQHPLVFEEARENLSQRILHCGYIKSRREYAKWLKRSTIVVSTSNHEFFGMSVIEAVRAGCRPILPARLSYPELFPREYLYNENEFAARLKDAVLEGKRLTDEQAQSMTDMFSWDTLRPVYEKWILNSRKFRQTISRQTE